jgi:hypothetical protein
MSGASWSASCETKSGELYRRERDMPQVFGTLLETVGSGSDCGLGVRDKLYSSAGGNPYIGGFNGDPLLNDIY